jgi:hypothetical protein
MLPINAHPRHVSLSVVLAREVEFAMPLHNVSGSEPMVLGGWLIRSYPGRAALDNERLSVFGPFRAIIHIVTA